MEGLPFGTVGEYFFFIETPLQLDDLDGYAYLHAHSPIRIAAGEQANAFLCRIGPSGDARLFHPGPFHFANGLALSAAEDFLYVVESTLDRVIRIPIGADGNPGPVEVFAEGLARVPDGLAFDAVGSLYVTCYASDTIYRVDASGRKRVLCRDRQAYLLNRPTNCAFAGSRLLIANLGGEHLAAFDLAMPGMPLLNQR